MSGEHCQMASMSGMPMQDTAPEMSPEPLADAAQATANARDDAAGKHARMSTGDACGYCSLLAHLPVMPAVETLFAASVRARQHTVVTRFHSVRRVEPLVFAQPRAPPAVS
jgi:hypothetical protein